MLLGMEVGFLLEVTLGFDLKRNVYEGFDRCSWVVVGCYCCLDVETKSPHDDMEGIVEGKMVLGRVAWVRRSLLVFGQKEDVRIEFHQKKNDDQVVSLRRRDGLVRRRNDGYLHDQKIPSFLIVGKENGYLGENLGNEVQNLGTWDQNCAFWGWEFGAVVDLDPKCWWDE